MTGKILQITVLAAVIFNFGCVFSKTSSNEQVSNSALSNGAANNAASVNAPEDTGAKLKGEIRQVDFKNFTYEPHCASEETQKLTVKKGEYSKDTNDDKIFFSVNSASYGDLTGDNADEAIVLSYCNTGGSGSFSEGFIYGMSDGKPKLLARLPGGDRAYGGLVSAKVENGQLVVVSNGEGEQGGACCPEFAVTTKYKLEGKELKQVGAETKKPLYAEERVKFAKGSTRSVMKIKVEDIKRFVIGANAGQVLSVTVDSKNVSIDLTKGDAEISNEENSLTATLKENGDYVIQLQNSAAKPTEVTLTVEIE